MHYSSDQTLVLIKKVLTLLTPPMQQHHLNNFFAIMPVPKNLKRLERLIEFLPDAQFEHNPDAERSQHMELI